MTGPPPGLAVERTVLAWTRTWLSAAVCAVLLLRLSAGSTVRTAASLAVGVLALVALTAAGRRRANRLRAAQPGPAVRAARVTATTVTLLGAAAAVLVATR